MKIKTLLLISLVFLPSFLCMGKGKETTDTISSKRAFIELTENGLDLLATSTRLDMLDYLDADSLVSVDNKLHGKSRLETVTPDFLELKLTDVSTMQIKILKQKDGKDIVMTIHTVGGEGDCAESDVMFFDAGMQPLPTGRFLPELKLADFFDLKGYRTNIKEIEEILPFYSVAIEANKDNSELTARLTSGDAMTVEDYNLVKMFMKPEVKLAWNGKKFIKN